ncbi:MAG: hypothetical protein WCI49_05515 [Ferruginibacter sp.]
MSRYQVIYCSIVLRVLLFPSTAFCQQPAVQTFIDKNDILIGEQIQYKVKASFPTGAFNIHWLNLPDSIAHFEVVDKSKIDSSFDNDKTVLQQTITLTSFDSGRWNTPALAIGFVPVNSDSTVSLFSDSIPINVGYAAPDSTNQLRDIKPIIEVTIKSYFWYYVGGGLLVLLLATYFLRRYLKNRKKDPALPFKSRITAYDEAMQELEKLKKLNLQNPEEIRQYHSSLAQIFKWYISRRQKLSVLNKTTGDVLVLLSNSNLSSDILSSVATALRCGDAVKFAKYLPDAAETEICLNEIKKVISAINIPKPLNL